MVTAKQSYLLVFQTEVHVQSLESVDVGERIDLEYDILVFDKDAGTQDTPPCYRGDAPEFEYYYDMDVPIKSGYYFQPLSP